MNDDVRWLILAYSEWLDGQGLVVPDGNGDDRTHDELVLEFLAQREECS